MKPVMNGHKRWVIAVTPVGRTLPNAGTNTATTEQVMGIIADAQIGDEILIKREH